MVTAVVLIEAETDKINTLAETLVEMNGIKEVFSVAGRYDLIAIVRVQSNEDVADVVSDSMRHLERIVKPETMIAFRVYTREDVEGMFSA